MIFAEITRGQDTWVVSLCLPRLLRRPIQTAALLDFASIDCFAAHCASQIAVDWTGVVTGFCSRSLSLSKSQQLLSSFLHNVALLNYYQREAGFDTKALLQGSFGSSESNDYFDLNRDFSLNSISIDCFSR